MKIDKRDILNTANLINIDVTENELDTIEQSILEMTSRFDEMLGIEVEGENLITPSNLENQFITDYNSDKCDDLFENINDFNGKFVETKKVIGDE